jgi:raffinose/stachyose/melibiose transport system substrate-binding protein
LASGTAGDVLNTWVGNGNPLTVEQLAPGGFLEDLSGQPFAEKLPKSIDPVTRVDGKLLIVPIALSFIGATYNKKLLAEFGLALPKTWDEFLNLCQVVKDKGLIPIAAGNGTAWVNQLWTYALVPSIVYAQNPNFNGDRRAGEVKFATSGWVEALEKYADLQKRGYFSPNASGTSFDEQLQMVAAGKAFMACTTSSALANVFKYSGNREFAMMPIPSSNDPETFWIPASPSNGYSINAKAENKDAAIEFLKFMTEPETVGAFSEAGQLATVVPSTPVPSVDSLYSDMMALFKQGKSTIFMDQSWPNARIQQVHNAGIQGLLAGRTTPIDLTTRMDEAYGV